MKMKMKMKMKTRGEPMRYRRFGKTELELPVISCGGMRFQYGWQEDEPIPEASDRNVAACLHRAFDLGIHHFETARGYGTSEAQMGKALPEFKRGEILLQTKVGPNKDVSKFAATFEKSMSLLGADYLDLFAFHGINDEETLEATHACMDTALAWKREGRIRHIGFATHGPTDIILKAIDTGMFEYVNLHWFYIQQDNWPAILEAQQRDMGVYIISPNDKGGMLYRPSQKLVDLCASLHPMVFNGLFCLAHPAVHSLSCGVSRPEDFDIHIETAEKLDDAAELIAPIEERLDAAMIETFGEAWTRSWQEGLPEWHETPGGVNIPVILRLRNLALAFDMIEYGKMRYNLLGNAGSWFPGYKVDKLIELKKDNENLEDELVACLGASPHAEKIPAALLETHRLLKGEEQKRLQA